jgi:mono/diheme cytochrome c family protein
MVATAPPVTAQEAEDTVEGPDVTVLDGVYTTSQAERGQATFSARCAGCHAPGFFRAGTFLRAWAGRPVRSLFRRVRRTMPEDNPGGLRAREYAAVIAYILELNDYPAGPDALPDDEEALRGILMVEREEGGG